MQRFLSLFTAFAMALTLVPAVQAQTDTEGPEIGVVDPLMATYTIPQDFTVSASDPSGVASCSLVVSSDFDNAEPMVLNSLTGLWEATWTFTTDRTANSIRARCTDTLGNVTNGPARVMNVSEVPIEPLDGDSGESGEGEAEVDATEFDRETIIEASPVLIKSQCPGGEDFTHPCRTVYFLDTEGVRHAFTNEKAFFTWYDNYDGLYVISEENMASYALGRNVRYHPGKKMVKFPSVNTVYVVGQQGALFPIASEDDARALYGDNWNQQIDDVSEVFVTNYTRGSTLHTAAELDVDTLRNSVVSINDNLGLAVLFD